MRRPYLAGARPVFAPAAQLTLPLSDMMSDMYVEDRQEAAKAADALLV